MKYLLPKPLNSSVRILNLNINITEEYTAVFNVTASLSYLLIRRNEKLALNLTDPNGNSYTFRHNPYHHRNNLHFPRFHLVKSPAVGSWILNAQGNASLSVQILGFTGLNKSGNCSDSDCHPNATCSEFGGYGECTCKEGFAGDGKSCNDIDECQRYYSNNCMYPNTCVNTIGSYTCKCSAELTYKAEFGCADYTDECGDSFLKDCDPVAICTFLENESKYGCTCPYGYYGDGRHCEVNECQQGSPCGSGAECFKYSIGSYSCIDPCSNHTVLNDPWRSTSNTYAYDMYGYSFRHDIGLSGWYRFKGEYDQWIPEHCVAMDNCGSYHPIWMNGSHPTAGDGIVNRTACFSTYEGCCYYPFNFSVKMCPEEFYVYKLQGMEGSTYCTESNSSCLGVSCAQGEECRILDSVPGCYCKNSSYTTDGMQPESLSDDLTPQVTCGLEKIEVRFGKCLLEKLGYNTSSLHLRHHSCRGITERRDKRYMTFITWPAHGQCGGLIRNNETVLTYTNTVYLTPNSDKGENRAPYPIDFHCSYPSDMEINLPTAVSTDKVGIFCYSSAPITVDGTANFSIKMDLFQDSGYTTPYNSSQVWLNSASMLYVAVIVTGDMVTSPFVLVMNNCYATPTPDISSGPRYDIITDQCPNKNNPTLSVTENGVSLRGRFSFKVFKFPGKSNQIYLHCQVGLCNRYRIICLPWCPSIRTSLDGNNVFNNNCKNIRPIN
ncbi:uromodulin-like [Lithobates pipiens]